MKKTYSFILTEAFLSDYNHNTYAEFKFLFSGNDLNQVLNRCKQEGYIFKSFSKKHGKVSSAYFLSPDKQKLIRVSDHWSKSNIDGVNECGQIGNCIWILVSNSKLKNRDRWQVGIVDIIKMKKL